MTSSDPTTEERDARLRGLVAHAYDRVSFYRERFRRAGVAPGDIRCLAAIARLPVTEKRDLLERPIEEITDRTLDPADLVATMTSGYSGEPFVIRRTRGEQARWARTWLEDLLRAGLRTGDRVATIFTLRDRQPDAIGTLAALGFVRETVVDCSLDPPMILREVVDVRPDFLRGMAGVVDRLAVESTVAELQRVRPRVVWVSGEVLTAAARERIETAFDAPVHNAYGAHEVGLVASDCPRGGLMHLGRPDLVVEVLDADGRTVESAGTGEIVVTPLDSFAAPLIRYRLTDVVTRGPDACPCGWAGPTLTHIEGRSIDYFEMPDGRRIHPYRILGPTLAAAPWIRQYQLVQESPERIVLRFVPREPMDDEASRGISMAVAPLLGAGVGFHVEAVARIPPGKGGKTRPILSLMETRASGRG
jgi:phenylacetate-CoA ligase